MDSSTNDVKHVWARVRGREGEREERGGEREPRRYVTYKCTCLCLYMYMYMHVYVCVMQIIHTCSLIYAPSPTVYIKSVHPVCFLPHYLVHPLILQTH